MVARERDPSPRWLALALAGGCAAGDASSVGSLSGPSSVGEGETTAGSTTDGESSTAPPSDTTGTASTVETSSEGGEVDETSCEPTTWYGDGDGDGRGSPDDTTSACDPPAGYVPFGDDCDDTDPARNPSAIEVCDTVDNDCDALVDEASASNTECNGCPLLDSGGHSYAFCPAGASWDAARTACAALGGDLLRLDDEAEHAAIVAFVEPPPGVAGGWYLGLSDIAAEGAFVWIDGGAPSFTVWNEGEPNDAAGNEDCAEIDLGAGGWNDVPCANPRAYVCESPVP